jgi:hypothetical protein
VSLMDQELLTSHNDVIQHGRSFSQSANLALCFRFLWKL